MGMVFVEIKVGPIGNKYMAYSTMEPTLNTNDILSDKTIEDVVITCMREVYNVFADEMYSSMLDSCLEGKGSLPHGVDYYIQTSMRREGVDGIMNYVFNEVLANVRVFEEVPYLGSPGLYDRVLFEGKMLFLDCVNKNSK